MQDDEDRQQANGLDGEPRRAIVALGEDPGDATWMSAGLSEMAAVPWRGDAAITDHETIDAWVDAAREAVAARGEDRVHVVAAGGAAYPAITLAARHPQLVASLLLGDPVVDRHLAEYDETLRAVTAPALVIASAPDVEQDIEQAQSVAGGIDNGVFVIIDGARVPAHRERGSSFSEWAVSFTLIAEGLDALSTSSISTTHDSQEEAHA